MRRTALATLAVAALFIPPTAEAKPLTTSYAADVIACDGHPVQVLHPKGGVGGLDPADESGKFVSPLVQKMNARGVTWVEGVKCAPKVAEEITYKGKRVKGEVSSTNNTSGNWSGYQVRTGPMPWIATMSYNVPLAGAKYNGEDYDMMSVWPGIGSGDSNKGRELIQAGLHMDQQCDDGARFPGQGCLGKAKSS